ncbi:hypothetical protein PanWU01x14_152740 [Parasponia andersonii]|uniref:Uncharacterized protein n=1 Tax=Parasponia andersonii TaxID=3476 RepID=A0A2P5CHF0_PARAD|nr:hypothetical protein PanWU01x14_152740 [Parasponia andersonii]
MPNLALISNEPSSLVGARIAEQLVEIPSLVARGQCGSARLGRGLMMWWLSWMARALVSVGFLVASREKREH